LIKQEKKPNEKALQTFNHLLNFYAAGRHSGHRY
jgi:hypothetical protein